MYSDCNSEVKKLKIKTMVKSYSLDRLSIILCRNLIILRLNNYRVLSMLTVNNSAYSVSNVNIMTFECPLQCDLN